MSNPYPPVEGELLDAWGGDLTAEQKQRVEALAQARKILGTVDLNITDLWRLAGYIVTGRDPIDAVDTTRLDGST